MSLGPTQNPTTAACRETLATGSHVGVSTSAEYVDVTRETRATNALILGLLGIFPFSILTGIPAIFVGAHALRRIKTSDGTLKGRRVAWCGIVLGCISIAIFSVFLYRVYR